MKERHIATPRSCLFPESKESKTTTDRGPVQLSYPHQNLHFLVVLQLLFVDVYGLVVMAAEHAVRLDHSFSHRT